MSKKNVADIITREIDNQHADGLCDTETSCGCGKDDLWPCGNLGVECELAKEYVCIKCGDPVYIPMDKSPDGWHHYDCGGGLCEKTEETETDTETGTGTGKEQKK